MKITRFVSCLLAAVIFASVMCGCDKQLADMMSAPVSETETAGAVVVTEETPPPQTAAPETESGEEPETAETADVGDQASSDETTAPETVVVADPREVVPDETSPSSEAPDAAYAMTIMPAILGYGVDYNCVHRFIFNQSYHNIFFFDKLVSGESFEEWRMIPDVKTDDCDFSNKNIYEFIKYFEISRDAFSKWYYSTNVYYLCDYDINLLYSSDDETVDTFYRSSGNYAEMMNRYGLLKIKTKLEEFVGREKYAGYIGVDTRNAEAMANGLANREAEWCISDFVSYFMITEPQLVSVIQQCMNEFVGREVSVNQSTTDGGRYILPDAEYSEACGAYSDIFSRINLDRLYTEEGAEQLSSALESDISPVLVDELLCTDITN